MTCLENNYNVFKKHSDLVIDILTKISKFFLLELTSGMLFKTMKTLQKITWYIDFLQLRDSPNTATNNPRSHPTDLLFVVIPNNIYYQSLLER